MRKLRDDITLREALKWARKEAGNYSYGCKNERIKDALYGIADEQDYGYPESFYSQPPIGSFGKFTFNNGLQDRWGHLGSAEGGIYKRREGGCFDHFTPGLPQDVDENGYPKEEK